MNVILRSASFWVLAAAIQLTACNGGAGKAAPGDSSGAPADATPRAELVVYAAASTRDVLQQIKPLYEASHNVNLVFNFGSSGDLSRQIIASPKADVFLSADVVEMDRVEKEKLVAAGSRRDVLSNQLVIIEPTDSASIFVYPFAAKQLTDSRIRHFAIADVESVPAGRYAKMWLEKTGVWSGLHSRILPGVDVRATLAAVESGAAQAGIVYRTDAMISQKARVVYAVPREEGPRIVYPIAAISGRPSEAVARSFADFLITANIRVILEEFGFIVLQPASSGT